MTTDERLKPTGSVSLKKLSAILSRCDVEEEQRRDILAAVEHEFGSNIKDNPRTPSIQAGQKSSGEVVERLSRLMREVRLLWETRGIPHNTTSRMVFNDIDAILSQLESQEKKGEG